MLLMYFRSDDDAARAVAHRVIDEGKDYEIGKGWTVRRDRSHHDPSNYHYHVQLNGSDVSVINGDGTQSHGSNRDRLPNWVVDKMIDQKLIDESAEPSQVHEIEPAVADKVRRIERYGIAFELDLLGEVLTFLRKLR